MPGFVRDENSIPRIQAVLKELGKKKLQIGVFAPEGSKAWIIATVNEYGTTITVTPKMRAYLHYTGVHLKADTNEIKIPERSFIRAGFDKNRAEIERVVEGLLPRVIRCEMTPNDFYSVIGELAVGKIREFIQSGVAPPNSKLTRDRKRSSKPLINTGALWQSIAYRVVDV